MKLLETKTSKQIKIKIACNYPIFTSHVFLNFENSIQLVPWTRFQSNWTQIERTSYKYVKVFVNGSTKLAWKLLHIYSNLGLGSITWLKKVKTIYRSQIKLKIRNIQFNRKKNCLIVQFFKSYRISQMGTTLKVSIIFQIASRFISFKINVKFLILTNQIHN